MIWAAAAEQELADIWLRADDRNVISQAAQAFDRNLRINPTNFGESRAAGNRIGFSYPLGITFRVREQDRQVLILDIWRTR